MTGSDSRGDKDTGGRYIVNQAARDSYDWGLTLLVKHEQTGGRVSSCGDEVVRRIGRMQAEKLFTFTRDNAAPVGSRATATSLIAIRQPKITASRVKKIATEGVMDKDHAHNAKRGEREAREGEWEEGKG